MVKAKKKSGKSRDAENFKDLGFNAYRIHRVKRILIVNSFLFLATFIALSLMNFFKPELFNGFRSVFDSVTVLLLVLFSYFAAVHFIFNSLLALRSGYVSFTLFSSRNHLIEYYVTENPAGFQFSVYGGFILAIILLFFGTFIPVSILL